MRFTRLLPLAALLALPTAAAQSAGCPELPGASGVSWETVDGPGFTYCKAMRDGRQAFSVMLRAESDFRERRSLREGGAVVIDGHQVHWYRGEVPNAIVRETLIEFADDSTAHIVLRADSQEQLAQDQRIAEQLRFQDARLGSN